MLGGLDSDFVLVNLPGVQGVPLITAAATSQVAHRDRPGGAPDAELPRHHADYRLQSRLDRAAAILAEDVLDGMRQDKNVLAKLRVYDKDGNEVDPGSIDWDSVSPDNFPYTLKRIRGRTTRSDG